MEKALNLRAVCNDQPTCRPHLTDGLHLLDTSLCRAGQALRVVIVASSLMLLSVVAIFDIVATVGRFNLLAFGDRHRGGGDAR